ncbi:hypothetical protein [Streptomyces sp. NPDC059850]|uniref:hypothetical protein n=1 Tax=Streptomyces sp. NPDC059850 TaxID=3346970 RepID=UPI0036474F62
MSGARFEPVRPIDIDVDRRAAMTLAIALDAAIPSPGYVSISPDSTLILANGYTQVSRIREALLLGLLRAEQERERIRREIAAQRTYGATQDALTSYLRDSAEEQTGLPSIRTDFNPAHPHLPVGDAAVDAVQRIELLRQQEAILSRRITRLRDLLALVLGTAHGDFAETVPPLDTSPCGVIRLAAPRIPRAPAETNCPLDSSHKRAIAA